jgi:hypothetical protein
MKRSGWRRSSELGAGDPVLIEAFAIMWRAQKKAPVWGDRPDPRKLLEGRK